MKKRAITTLIIALMLLLTACVGGGNQGEEPEPDEGEKVTISYWNPLTGADGVVMRRLVRDFNKEHEGVYEVIETYANEEDHYDNLEMLIPINRGPDVSIVHSHIVQSYANEELIIPIDDYIINSEVEINKEDYVENVFNSLYYKDELYGIPLDLHTVGIYYNKTILEKYNLEVPTNREELLNVAKEVQEKEDASGFWSFPLSTVWPSEWIFTTALYQNGGKEINNDDTPAFNSAEGLKAMKMLADLIHVHKLSPSTMSVDQDLFAFQQGKALFHIQGTWMLNAIKDSAKNYEFGVIPLSNMFTDEDNETKNQIAARSHTFVVPESKNVRSKAKQKAIMTFIKYLGDNSYVWAEAGQIPASNIARETEEYKAIEYIHDFGEPENFRVSAQSPYFRHSYPVVYQRVTQVMSISNNQIDRDYTDEKIKALLKDAETEGLQLLASAKD